MHAIWAPQQPATGVRAKEPMGSSGLAPWQQPQQPQQWGHQQQQLWGQQQQQQPRQWGWQQQQQQQGRDCDDDLGLVTPSKRISATGISRQGFRPCSHGGGNRVATPLMTHNLVLS